MGSTIVAKGALALPGWAPLEPPSAPPQPLGAAMEACFVSSMASGTPSEPQNDQTWIFFGRVQGSAEYLYKTNCESFPLSKGVFAMDVA